MRHDREWSWRMGPLSLALALSIPALGACQAVEQTNVRPGAESVEEKVTPEVTLQNVEVLRVRLRKELIRPDAAGEDRAWAEAFMVQLGIPEPPATGPALYLYLDDERVPEYGGWEGGIYFWVYDPDELTPLEGRSVSVQFGRGERTEIGTLTLGDPQAIRQVSEAELFPR